MRVTILDSDKRNIKNLSDFIREKYPKWIVNAYPTTFELATAVYDKFKGDVELVMVHVDADSSIELARDLQEQFPQIRVIFYSETTECAEKILMAVPTFFLHLPFHEENIAIALERVRVKCEESLGKTFTIHSHGRKQKIRFSAIRYMESLGRKMLLYTDDGSFETYMTVREAISKLPPQFIQCHRSYIINSDKIEKYSTDGVLLVGMMHVPISRSFQKKLRKILS